LNNILVSLVNENGDYPKVITESLNQGEYGVSWGYTWAQIPEGLNKLTISLDDYAGNTNNILPVEIRKDVTTPNIAQIVPIVSYEDRWFSNTNGFQPDGDNAGIDLAGIDIDFVDTQSYVQDIWAFISHNNLVIASKSIVINADVPIYQIDWSLEFASFNEGYNEVFVSYNDYAGFKVFEKVFSIKKILYFLIY